MNVVVHFPSSVEVEDSGALSLAQRAFATVSSSVKQAVPLMLVPQKS
jgi:hypothetical protein